MPALAAWIAEKSRPLKSVRESFVVKLSSAALCCAVQFPLLLRHRSLPSPGRARPARASRRCARRRAGPARRSRTRRFTPTAYWCGLSNVARSLIFAGSNTTMSAKQPLSQAAAILQLEALGRLARQAADRVLQRHHLLVAHVAAEEAREVAVGARMRIDSAGTRLPAPTPRRPNRCSPTAATGRASRSLPTSGSTPSDARVILDHEIDRRVLGRHAAHLRDLGERLAGQRLELVGLESDRAARDRASRRRAAGFPSSRRRRASPRSPACGCPDPSAARPRRRYRPACTHGGIAASSPVAPAVYVYMSAVTAGLPRAPLRSSRSPGPSSASSSGRRP